MFSFEGVILLKWEAVIQGYSSAGRALVSKTKCRGFESFCPCHFFKNDSPFIYGSVAQLVRAPACHAGGRGFEPHLSRFVEV